jgi:hypothetical protein
VVAELYSLDTRAAVKQFVTYTERAIRAGRLAPGGSFSLREAAEELSVRWAALRMQLEPLEREGLLAVGWNGTATVAPLDIEEFEAMGRFRLLVLPDMAARASTRRDSETITRQRAGWTWVDDLDQFPIPAHAHRDGNWTGTAMDEFWRGAASQVEIRQATMLFDAVQRYHRLGYLSLLDDVAEARAWQRDFQTGFQGLLVADPAEAHEASVRVNERAIEVSRRSLRIAQADGSSSRAFAGKRPSLKLV